MRVGPRVQSGWCGLASSGSGFLRAQTLNVGVVMSCLSRLHAQVNDTANDHANGNDDPDQDLTSSEYDAEMQNAYAGIDSESAWAGPSGLA